MIRSFYDGVKNIIRWIPIIYKDRDWDYFFFMNIIQFKLKNMEKFFKEYGVSVNSERDAREMRKCILLLDRIMEDNYCDREYNKLDKKWGKVIIDNGKLCRSKIISEEDEKQERKEIKRLIERENSLKNQDMDLLFKILRKQIFSWWD